MTYSYRRLHTAVLFATRIIFCLMLTTLFSINFPTLGHTATPVVDSSAIQNGLSLLPYLEYYSDPTGSLTVQSLSALDSQTSFQPLINAHAAKLNGTTWLRFTIIAPDKETWGRHLRLDLGEEAPTGGILYEKIQSDEGRLQSSWATHKAMDNSIFVFRSPSAPESTLYFKLPGAPGLWFSPILSAAGPISAAAPTASAQHTGIIHTALTIILLLVTLIAFLRAFSKGGEWRVWTGVMSLLTLLTFCIPIPVMPEGVMTIWGGCKTLAAGLALLVFFHMGRHMLQTAEKKTPADAFFRIFCIAAAVLTIYPFIPGQSWFSRYTALWPLLAAAGIIPAVLCTSYALYTAMRYIIASIVLCIGAMLALSAIGTPAPGVFEMTASYWGVVLASCIIAIPGRKKNAKQEDPANKTIMTIPSQEASPAASLLVTENLTSPQDDMTEFVSDPLLSIKKISEQKTEDLPDDPHSKDFLILPSTPMEPDQELKIERIPLSQSPMESSNIAQEDAPNQTPHTSKLPISDDFILESELIKMPAAPNLQTPEVEDQGANIQQTTDQLGESQTQHPVFFEDPDTELIVMREPLPDVTEQTKQEEQENTKADTFIDSFTDQQLAFTEKKTLAGYNFELRVETTPLPSTKSADEATIQTTADMVAANIPNTDDRLQNKSQNQTNPVTDLQEPDKENEDILPTSDHWIKEPIPQIEPTAQSGQDQAMVSENDISIAGDDQPALAEQAYQESTECITVSDTPDEHDSQSLEREFLNAKDSTTITLGYEQKSEHSEDRSIESSATVAALSTTNFNSAEESAKTFSTDSKACKMDSVIYDVPLPAVEDKTKLLHSQEDASPLIKNVTTPEPILLSQEEETSSSTPPVEETTELAHLKAMNLPDDTRLGDKAAGLSPLPCMEKEPESTHSESESVEGAPILPKESGDTKHESLTADPPEPHIVALLQAIEEIKHYALPLETVEKLNAAGQELRAATSLYSASKSSRVNSVEHHHNILPDQSNPDPFNLHDLLHEICSSLKNIVDEHGSNLSCELSPSLPQIVTDIKELLQKIIYQMLYDCIQYTKNTNIRLIATSVNSETDPGAINFTIEISGIADGAYFQPKTEGMTLAWQAIAHRGGKLVIDTENTSGKSRVSLDWHLTTPLSPGKEYPGGESSLPPAPPKPVTEENKIFDHDSADNETFSTEGSDASNIHLETQQNDNIPLTEENPETEDQVICIDDDLEFQEEDSVPEDEPILTAHRTLLVADALEANRQIFAFFLEGLPFTVIEARNLDEARARYKFNPTSMILIEPAIAVRGIKTAIEFFHELDEEAGRIPAPVIALINTPEQADSMYEAGCADVLLKPFSRRVTRELMIKLALELGALEEAYAKKKELEENSTAPSEPDTHERHHLAVTAEEKSALFSTPDILSDENNITEAPYFEEKPLEQDEATIEHKDMLTPVVEEYSLNTESLSETEEDDINQKTMLASSYNEPPHQSFTHGNVGEPRPATQQPENAKVGDTDVTSIGNNSDGDDVLYLENPLPIENTEITGNSHTDQPESNDTTPMFFDDTFLIRTDETAPDEEIIPTEGTGNPNPDEQKQDSLFKQYSDSNTTSEGVDRELIPLIPELIKNLSAALGDASQGKREDEPETVERACHKLTSIAGMHGLRAIQRIAACVERAAEARDREAIADLLSELELTVSRNIKILQQQYAHSFEK